jgi:tryptophan synthase alpha chain
MNRIEKKFRQLKKEGKKAFIPYIMAGDPSLEETKSLFTLLEDCGADIIELGVPFSDPLADGPVIQRASERALSRGVTLRDVIAVVKDIRAFSDVPIALMTYYNPVFKYGEEDFLADAASYGVDGLIIPDLPPDEAGNIIRKSKEFGLSVIFLLAPTSTPERVKKVVKTSSGFIYYVSITGITGARLMLGGMKESIEGIRALTDKPVAVGFGVSTPEEAEAVSGLADGVIVGSAIVKKVAESGEKGGYAPLKEFLLSLREAIR